MTSSNRPERVFSSLLLDQINFPDVNAILDSQTQIIHKLDETNRSLTRTNQLSAETFNSFAVKDFQSYVALLAKMKADLELIFKHIRVIKSKLQAKYPSQYDKAFNEFCISVDDDEDVGNGEKNDQEIEVSRRTMINNNSINNNSPLGSLTKERSISNESDKSSSTKSILVNLFETARTRLSSMELVGGLVGGNSTQSSQQQQKHQSSNNQVDSEQQKLEPSEQPNFLNEETVEEINDDNKEKDEEIVKNVNKEDEGEKGDFQSVNLTSLKTDESTA